jgi:hypothetical protein
MVYASHLRKLFSAALPHLRMSYCEWVPYGAYLSEQILDYSSRCWAA